MTIPARDGRATGRSARIGRCDAQKSRARVRADTNMHKVLIAHAINHAEHAKIVSERPKIPRERAKILREHVSTRLQRAKNFWARPIFARPRSIFASARRISARP